MPIRIGNSPNGADKTLAVLGQSQSPIIQEANLITSIAVTKHRPAPVNVERGFGRVRPLNPQLDGKGLQLQCRRIAHPYAVVVAIKLISLANDPCRVSS